MITILAEDEVKDDYLTYLQSIGVFYIFAGKNNIDLQIALKKLKSLFGIDKVLLEGGTTSNQSFFKENIFSKIFLIKASIISQSESKNVFGDHVFHFGNLIIVKFLMIKVHFYYLIVKLNKGFLGY